MKSHQNTPRVVIDVFVYEVFLRNKGVVILIRIRDFDSNSCFDSIETRL